MNKINRKMEYALIALKHMNGKRPGELTSAKEISDTYGSPFDATSRVLQIMGQHKVVKSEHGANGGYMIVKDLKSLTLHSLMEMLVGPLNVAKCLQDGCDLLTTCNIVSPVSVLNSKLEEFYRAVIVADLICSKVDIEITSKSANLERA